MTTLLSIALLTCGCLQDSYSIDRTELSRIASTLPEARGRVRATQRLGTDSDPPGVQALGPEYGETGYYGPPVYGPELVTSVVIGGHHGHRGRRRPRHRGLEVVPGRLSDATAVPDSDDDAPRQPTEHGPRGGEREDSLRDRADDERASSPGGDALRSRRTDSQDDGDDTAAAIAFVAAAAVGGVVLAATEGLRFEGDLQLSREQPIYLRGPADELLWVSLGDLTPELAAWADEGVVTEADGLVQRLGRAPLNRRGFAFSADLGTNAANTLRSDVAMGFAARATVGVFPIHSLGLLGGGGVTIGEQGDVEWRVFGEAQVYPVSFGALELGFYGQFGKLYGSVLDATSSVSNSVDSLFGGGGLLLQLDLTTRLALTFRAGAMYVADPASAYRPEVLLGLAVY